MDKKEIIKVLAGNLRAERARKNYSQEYLAELVGISPEYLNRIEREKYNPSIVVIIKIAYALNIDLNTIFPIK